MDRIKSHPVGKVVETQPVMRFILTAHFIVGKFSPFYSINRKPSCCRRRQALRLPISD